ncbi:NADH-quinone oxidoreductase subunit J [Sunxiuqinia dokdonensis]|uniref:NADH-quinone oxidoreductase subunit J n=1 Tax=Sunxiuqinia dokdonensis TaxID=1409788 RepID=A0A0L8V6A1_9BACT|nr:NADH-quinone oxidoreductase subunit J [Sunxiuqinia dokdonensis]KOH43707.1 NADH dehydrogenase (quinone) [Sunxiuqinia dokdonensis]|tara:strand:+ start:5201 stop:5731 length:531 start_codon:yes stop_codon:yes gene_type:complete
MNILFYIAATAAIVSTLMMVISKNVVHSLLFLIVSLFSVSVVMFIIGAPFVAALEVIIYAGAIMVLFVFVIMMLNLSDEEKRKKRLMKSKIWIGPSAISLILLAEMVYVLTAQPGYAMGQEVVLPVAVGELMFTKYIVVVELAAFLLIAGIIGAYHLGQKEKTVHHRYLKNKNQEL